jgi:hypothetical protein
MFSLLGMGTDRQALDVELHGQSIGVPNESDVDERAVMS